MSHGRASATTCNAEAQHLHYTKAGTCGNASNRSPVRPRLRKPTNRLMFWAAGRKNCPRTNFILPKRRRAVHSGVPIGVDDTTRARGKLD